MSIETVKVNMLGDFSIEWNGAVIADTENRSRKIWLLLAYMIYNRSRSISQEELSELLWNDGGSDVDPRGAIKTSFFRVRAMLDGLGKGTGRTLILNDKGNYYWNPDIPVRLDAECFEEFVNKAHKAADEGEMLDYYQQALDEYHGGFLHNMQMDFWVMPLNAYFSNAWLETTLTAIDLMEKRQLTDSTVALCREAVKREPYNEDLSLHLMKNLLEVRDTKGIAEEYARISEQLNDMFGIQPCDEIRAIYRKAQSTLNENGVSFDIIYDQLQEQDAERGALVCDYDFFRVLYHSAARSIARSGDVVHIALFTLQPAEESLSKSSLSRAMDNLQDQLRISLRSGDSVARCSGSQFIVMLQQANFENCNMVCDRVVRAYKKQYPHSPARPVFSVRPIKPL